jgi:hypothetical protein
LLQTPDSESLSIRQHVSVFCENGLGSVGYIVIDLLRWILIQCTTVRDDVAVLRRKLACAHYRERLIVKVCPFSGMFLYFVEIMKMDIDSMHNCYRYCGIEQGIGIRTLLNIS